LDFFKFFSRTKKCNGRRRRRRRRRRREEWSFGVIVSKNCVHTKQKTKQKKQQ
jgi:hypothetical protein